eukprot:3928581-Prorocentrum_lima.AAC.1
MTSSLVGSEMCIRDRVKFEYDFPRDACSLARRPLQLRVARFTVVDAFQICLLYTSDAADDM